MKNIIMLLMVIMLGACAEDGNDGTNGTDGNAGIDGLDGIDGSNGVDGLDGTSGLQSIYDYTQSIYKTHRQSTYQITVMCDYSILGWGTGFRLTETEVATNKHVTGMLCNGVKSFQLDHVDDLADVINPINTITVFDHIESAEYDLAKIYVPVTLTGTPVTLANGPFYLNGETGQYTVTLSFPLAFRDLYTVIGQVSANYTCFYDFYDCPDWHYDFIITNDLDSGASGSAIFDMVTGNVIGIVTATVVGPGVKINPYYAIDADKLNNF